MIILTKNILKRKKQKFNDNYDHDDSFSIHNLTKPNTSTTIQPPKMMEKGMPREFIDIATNTDTIATETRETQEKLYNDANQQLNMTFEAFKVKENQDNMFKIMLKNFWHNAYKRHEPTRTQATQTLKTNAMQWCQPLLQCLTTTSRQNHRQRNHQTRRTAMKKKKDPN